MRLGLHLSISKGLGNVATTAEKLGCEAFQIFIGNPRGWGRKPLDVSDVREFQKQVKRSVLGPVAVHLSYLPNPAADDEDLYEKSIIAMGEDYRRAVEIGADYFVVHPGKAGNQSLERAISKVAMGMKTILSTVKGKTIFLLENQAGGGREIAGRISELGMILKEVNCPERIGICLDTCHAFVAGYDLRCQQGLNQLLTEIQETVGLSRMPLLHLNDALGALGSHLDRHANIGEGQIGLKGFRLLLSDQRTSQLAGVLETPKVSADDDRRNLAILRQLLRGGGK